MTAEQFAKNMERATKGVTATGFSGDLLKLATAMREQEIRNIMAFTGCSRERAEKLRVWLHDDEVVIGGLHKVERAGKTLGERLTEGFARLAAIGRSYRT